MTTETQTADTASNTIEAGSASDATVDNITDNVTETISNITAARESFSGKSLTEGQFREALAITSIIKQEIQQSGSFREKLTDYAHAYSRSEKFDAARGETILRDIYQGSQGETMNQTREALKEREEKLEVKGIIKERVLSGAESIERLIQKGETQPFYKAYDQAAIELSKDLSITQAHAKSLMKETYREATDRSLYETGKEIENAYHKPVREAEIAARKAEQLQTRGQTRSQSRSR